MFVKNNILWYSNVGEIMSKKEEINIQNETLLKKISLNAKKELIKYNLLHDLINYKYTILLDSVDINDILGDDGIAVYYNDFINDISDFVPRYVNSVEFLRASILVVRFYEELNLKVLNEIVEKIKKVFGKKVPILFASQEDKSEARIHITFIGIAQNIVM